MKSDKIPVDILTCDRRHYVRCARMCEVLDLLPAEVLDLIERREWTLRTGEGQRAFQVFQGKAIPTLCVDGHKCFENQIPTTDQLYLALAVAARTDEQRDIITRAWAKSDAEDAPVKPDLVRAH